ncbi:MAG TPA: PIG-L family deacetylase [Thermoanaerobaculia bacterium]|nr:PIG-L family deacetylase [Thermoanaerobaculia bacterium]
MNRFVKPIAASVLSLMIASVGAVSAQEARGPLAPQPLEPAGTGGIATVERALAKLMTHKRLLVVAAHPDDEDTSLLTLIARGMGGEAAYLSLSRGEGGQNLIGPELGVGLGLIRSRELLAARAVDGGRQFFTRAFDFGYTRSLDETLTLWPREVLLEDAVRVIRRFKPQVIVSIFPGVPHPNHGQHQAAGVTAYEAFRLAGDPAALPRLRQEGLLPWKPQALFRSTFFSPDATTLVLSTAPVDPITGKSIEQLAMASRSMHRSQDMGLFQQLGPDDTRVGWVEGGAGAQSKDLFEGIDTRVTAIAAVIPEKYARRHAGEHLETVAVRAEQVRRSLSPSRLSDAVPGLAEIRKNLRAVYHLVEDRVPEAERRPVLELIQEKIDAADLALAAAAGVAVDAFTERETLIQGETFPVRAVLWNSGGGVVENVRVTLLPTADNEWGGGPIEPKPPGQEPPPAPGTSPRAAPNPAIQVPPGGSVPAGQLAGYDFEPAVPAQAALTVPYFLRKPLAGAGTTGSLYDWSDSPASVKGEPFGPPPLTARFSFTIDGAAVTLEREVVHRHRDQALGEIRRPLRVVPRVEVQAAEDLLVWPVARREPRRLQVTVSSNAREAVRGRLELSAPAPWPAVTPVPFALEPGGEHGLELVIPAPRGLAPGRYDLRLSAVLADGQRFDLAVPVLDYPHIRPTPQPDPARLEVSAADLQLPPLKRVGYVRGASDRVPEFLSQAGVPLEMVGIRELEGDLSRYDAIVVGSRAYETDPALARANPRLLDYARAGGLVIVQYQQYPFIQGKFAPLALDIARPHDRVTDETAAVRVLAPSHPLFTTPNRIGPEDWQGWIQERGLYFANTWDPAYVPLLSMADPGGPELRGGLLVAPLGKGHYVYTGLAFFRQIPAGVPGAYRLFANLLALGGRGGK